MQTGEVLRRVVFDLLDAAKGGRLKKGDKVYSVWMNKSVALFHIGEKKMDERSLRV